MKEYPNTLLLRFYREMLRIRLCEESLVEPIVKGTIRCPCHLYSGEEAIAVGICSALRKTDMVFGNHRSHGHYLAKGGDMNAMVAEIFGKQTGCAGGRGGSMHVIDTECGFLGAAPIVAGTISLATGAALAARLHKKRQVVVSFFGDGAAGEGVLYEALNFAALHNLPLIFACENNLYSTHLPIRECRAQLNISRSASAMGVNSKRVDGNDLLAVHAAANKAVDLCRRGRGPFFMELMTYRLRGHVGPDDNVQGAHTDIRPKKEIARWRRKDPITQMERRLVSSGVIDTKKLADLQRKVQREVEAAHKFAMRSPLPRTRTLKDHVFLGVSA